MIIREIDNFFFFQNEPVKSCLQFLREHLLGFDENITEAWKYNMPFYFFKKERFCYLWIHTKTRQPYIGFTDGKRMEHPLLIFEKRSRIKIMLIDAEKDILVNDIDAILQIAIAVVN